MKQRKPIKEIATKARIARLVETVRTNLLGVSSKTMRIRVDLAGLPNFRVFRNIYVSVTTLPVVDYSPAKTPKTIPIIYCLPGSVFNLLDDVAWLPEIGFECCVEPSSFAVVVISIKPKV